MMIKVFVSIFSPFVLGWRGPASWRPLTRVTNIGYSTPRGQDRA
jgi:hypothetical protein